MDSLARLLTRLRQSALQRPSALDSPIDARPRDSQTACPNRDGKCLTVERDWAHTPAVLPLLLCCRPAAVLGRIGPVVVDPVDRVKRRWGLSHVGKELLKTLAPARVDDDPAAAVIPVRSVLGVVATVDHMPPTLVHRCAGHSMRQRAAGSEFADVTTAGNRAPASEVGLPYLLLRAADAATQPVTLRSSKCGRPDDRQSAVALTYLCCTAHAVDSGVDKGTVSSG